MGKYTVNSESNGTYRSSKEHGEVNQAFDSNGIIEMHDVNEKKEKKKKAKKNENVTVGFTELFRYADGTDKILMTIGTIFAICHGAGIQINFIILADVLDKFIEIGSRNESLIPVNDTSGSDEILELVPDIVLQFCLNAIGVLIFGYTHMMCWTMTAERQIRVIRTKAFRSVLKQHIGWFDTQQSGELNIRMTSDIINMHSGMGDKVTTFIQWTFTFIIGTIICLIYGWELTLVMLACSPLVVGVGGAVAKSLQSFATKEVTAYAKAGGVANEVLSGIRIITAYNGHVKEAARYEHHLAEARKVGIKRGLVNGIGQGVLWLLIFSVIALAFWYGNELIKTAGYTGGTIMLVQFCLFNGMRALGQAISNLENFAMARSSAGSVFSLMESESEIDSTSESGHRPSTMEGTIKLSNVSFRYPSRQDYQALADVDITLPNGKTVAIVGPSGSGKSTIVQLVQRFYDPEHGSITLDGRDMKELNVSWLRSQIGVVQQEPVLFATSIGENIKFGLEGSTQADVERAAKEANAHNFIMKLPKGYDTPVGARGGQLSGGQKQRVAIARALIRRPNILILDDATSALDYQSEAVVQEALDKNRHNRTTLIIAHRLSTVRNADIICCIDQGKIIEMGTHDELIKLGGLYCKLVNKQGKGDEDSEESEEESEDEILDEDFEDVDLEDGIIHNGIVSASPVDSNMMASFGRRASSARKRASSRASHASMKRKGSARRRKRSEKSEEKPVVEEEPVYPAPASRIFKLNGSEWPMLLVGSLAAITQGSIWPLLAMFASEILAAFTIQDPQEQQDAINDYVYIIVGVGVGACVSTFLMIFLFNWSGEKLTERLRGMAFKSMMKQEIGWYDERKNQVGSLTSRLATDASMVKSATGTALSTFVNAISTVTLSVFVAFFFGWKLALVASIFIPPLVATGMVQTKLLVGFARGSKSSVEEGGKLVSEAIDNIRTVAALGKEKFFLDSFSSHFEKSYQDGKKRSHVFGVTWGLSQSILFFAYAANYGFGAYLVSRNEMEFENVFRVFVAISTGAIELGRINAFASDYSKAKVSAGKLFQLFDRVPAIDGTVDKGKKPHSCNGAVEFRGCDFRYPTRKEIKILNSLNVSISPGETLALVGPSGCGKSTTIQLLERFYDPEDGVVYLDGQNIKETSVQWLRNQIGLVAQEPTLFDATVRENIAYGDLTREVPMAEIIEAAKMANIHSFVQELPKGYETVCGPSGVQLVGGQKQRITIARALVKNPKILLLDEATSALDTENEKIVQEALDRAQVGRTCIVIAHRLSTIENAHKIAVIESGVVVEQGRHEELMQKGGLYYQLQLIQMGAK